MEIIPSKPFKTFEDLEFLASSAKNRVSRVQVDICDGRYVESVSWPLTEYSINDFQNLYKKGADLFLPEWEDLDYVADLMVLHPVKYIDSLVQYGFGGIIVHFRSVETLEEWSVICKMVRQFDLGLVLAIDVKTDLKSFIDLLEANKDLLECVSGFQVMGIENIGKQGQSFDERSLVLVDKIKSEYPEKNIWFDGAINDETIEKIKESGVNIFCVGSFLTENNFAEVHRYLKSVLI